MKRYKQRPSSLAVKVVVIGCASCVLVGGIGIGIASAGGGASSSSDAFGLSAQSASLSSGDASSLVGSTQASARESNVLSSSATRDITQGIQAITAQEEAERRAAEEAKRVEEAERVAAAEAAKAAQREAASGEAAASALAQLSDVDWSQGKDAFVAQWTARINAYLVGSPLAGHGETFALAAWNNGIDPRWSPAISNTESSKGEHCFLSYNAWGWGNRSWSNWDEAINSHVAGLANGYGYSLTYASAAKYCPPNTDHWFNNTLSQMLSI